MDVHGQIDGATRLQANPGDVAIMAALLEGRHGIWAEDVAEFFADLHLDRGDRPRSGAWLRVVKAVRLRASQRLTDAGERLGPVPPGRALAQLD